MKVSALNELHDVVYAGFSSEGGLRDAGCVSGCGICRFQP